MASAFIDQGLNEEALLCYRQMIEEGLDPNQAAFVVATQACGMIPYRKGKEKVLLLDIGIGLHTDAQKKNLASDAFVVTTLVSMYGKLGALSNAKHAFKYLAHPTVPSCNSLMAACIENGSIEEALQLYVKVRNLGLNPDEQTYVATLQASSVLAERDGRESEPSSHHVQIVQEIVQALHIDAHKDGFTSNVFAGTTLLSAYGKCWLVSEAENIFVQLPNSNLTTWNAMLCVYADRGEPGKAVHLYRKMLNQDIGVDDATHLSVLQACCEIGSIDLCTEMHFYIICNGSDCNMHLLCSILHAYGSSMSMQEFGSVLNMLAHFDIVLLNAGVTAHGREGDFAATDSLFNQWYLAGFKPDGVTFTILLTACSHAGLVDPGVWYFELMTSHHDLLAESTHLVCMIDLLGRAGSFYKVENILRGIKAHDAIAVWSSLMSACYKHCNYELGTSLFLQASSLWPEDTSTYVLMSNMHSIFVHHENAE
ncbi:hypothetical protein KP509_39G026000 [Ceratopteris richardii]|nr:hypothetical protein KP509_39G026000 [Ceratopteris richardii]